MFSWENLECHRSFNYWQFISHVFLSSAIAETQNFLSDGLSPCAFMCFPPPREDGLVGTMLWPLCDVQWGWTLAMWVGSRAVPVNGSHCYETYSGAGTPAALERSAPQNHCLLWSAAELSPCF